MASESQRQVERTLQRRLVSREEKGREDRPVCTTQWRSERFLCIIIINLLFIRASLKGLLFFAVKWFLPRKWIMKHFGEKLIFELNFEKMNRQGFQSIWRNREQIYPPAWNKNNNKKKPEKRKTEKKHMKQTLDNGWYRRVIPDRRETVSPSSNSSLLRESFQGAEGEGSQVELSNLPSWGSMSPSLLEHTW